MQSVWHHGHTDGNILPIEKETTCKRYQLPMIHVAKRYELQAIQIARLPIAQHTNYKRDQSQTAQTTKDTMELEQQVLTI